MQIFGQKVLKNNVNICKQIHVKNVAAYHP